MAQANRIKFTSELGRAQYPWLNQPDTAFGAEPRYKTNLIVENGMGNALEQLCRDLADSEFGAKAKKARMPFDFDDETGETVFKAKSKYAPAFFDSTGNPITGQQIPPLWGGSVIKIGGYISPYSVSGSVGVSLQLTRVQIIEPVSSGGDADGFEAVEGGFKAGDDFIAEDTSDNEEQVLAKKTESADRF